MDKRVLEIITENLMNERLDSIVQNNEEYRQAEQEPIKRYVFWKGCLVKNSKRLLMTICPQRIIVQLFTLK
ncbi:MAG: hypothetical protein HDR06_03335 [Lachnospiraceae bacterium]|nr:hypothetical protein [Lachnospiraceae bacterium]